MNISIATSNKSYVLTPEGDEKISTKYLIGSKKARGSGIVTAERCLINDIVLGLGDPEKNIVTWELIHDKQLKDYQREDVLSMINMHNCLNANRMGYGKTVETIIALRNLYVDNILLIVPNSIVYQWEDQLERWWPQCTDRIVILDGTQRTLPSEGIFIVNYEKVPMTRVFNLLKSRRWDVIVADEAHRVKNPKGQRANAVRDLPASRRWALTGTPIVDRPDDLYGVLKFVDPYIVGNSYWNFREFFCNLVQGPFGLKNEGLTKDERKIELLQEILKRNVIMNPELHLSPGKDVEIVKLKMTKDQLALYNKVANIILDELPEDMTIPNGAVRCLRLQQVTSSPMQWNECIIGAKFQFIKDTLDDNPNEKFVIFSCFATTCKLLQKYLKVESTSYIGELDNATRNEHRLKFVQDPKCRVLIGTIGAMGEGVDGLQEVCHNVIFIDRAWSSEILEQCEDRLNRMGQHERVLVQYLECMGTYDRYVGRVTLNKAEDIKKILNRGGLE